jgi:hypothetical protein
MIVRWQVECDADNAAGLMIPLGFNIRADVSNYSDFSMDAVDDRTTEQRLLTTLIQMSEKPSVRSITVIKTWIDESNKRPTSWRFERGKTV